MSNYDFYFYKRTDHEKLSLIKERLKSGEITADELMDSLPYYDFHMLVDMFLRCKADPEKILERLRLEDCDRKTIVSLAVSGANLRKLRHKVGQETFNRYAEEMLEEGVSAPKLAELLPDQLKLQLARPLLEGGVKLDLKELVAYHGWIPNDLLRPLVDLKVDIEFIAEHTSMRNFDYSYKFFMANGLPANRAARLLSDDELMRLKTFKSLIKHGLTVKELKEELAFRCEHNEEAGEDGFHFYSSDDIQAMLRIGIPARLIFRIVCELDWQGYELLCRRNKSNKSRQKLLEKLSLKDKLSHLKVLEDRGLISDDDLVSIAKQAEFASFRNHLKEFHDAGLPLSSVMELLEHTWFDLHAIMVLSHVGYEISPEIIKAKLDEKLQSSYRSFDPDEIVFILSQPVDSKEAIDKFKLDIDFILGCSGTVSKDLIKSMDLLEKRGEKIDKLLEKTIYLIAQGGKCKDKTAILELLNRRWKGMDQKQVLHQLCSGIAQSLPPENVEILLYLGVAADDIAWHISYGSTIESYQILARHGANINRLAFALCGHEDKLQWLQDHGYDISFWYN